jgi:hypothetical protein
LDPFGLRVRQEATRTDRAPGAALGESRRTPVGIGGPPAADRFAGDAEDVGDLALGQTQFTGPHGPQAQGFQDFIG